MDICHNKWFDNLLLLLRNQTFETCVDELIKEDMLPKLSCIPPWLSSTKQCNKVVSSAGFNKENFSKNYIEPAYHLQRLQIEHRCKKPCLATRTNVQLRNADKFSDNETWIKLKFNEEVLVLKKISGYTFF